jgi:hypothetical protein
MYKESAPGGGGLTPIPRGPGNAAGTGLLQGRGAPADGAGRY